MARKPIEQLSPAYRKRVESYLKRHPGAKREAARGHKEESLERLRRRTRRHMLLQLAAAGTRQPVSEKTIRKHVDGMSRDMMRWVLLLDGNGIKVAAAARTAEDWGSFFDDEAPDDFDRTDNPFWYHASS